MGTIDLPKFTLDFDNRLFIAKAGVTEIDIGIDMYSDWKEGILANNSGGEAKAMDAAGGNIIDPLTLQALGTTYFLLNGYKIRPQETDHTLTIVGNIFSQPAGLPLFVPTTGAFTVALVFKVSNLVDASVARIDLTQLQPSVFMDSVNGVPGTSGSIGKPTNPVDNMIDARTLADLDNLRSYEFRNALTATANHSQWRFKGLTSKENDALALGGFDFTDSFFEGCTLTGSYSGLVHCTDCILNVVTGLEGTFAKTGLDGNLATASSSSIEFVDCHSSTAGSGTPILTVGANTTVEFRNYSGGIQLNNVSAGNIISVDLDPGHLILDSSCTGGTVLVRGNGRLTRNDSDAVTVIDLGLLDAREIHLTNQLIAGNATISTDNRTVTILDKDNVTVLATYDVSVDGRARTRLT
jgi:hypothetical protein